MKPVFFFLAGRGAEMKKKRGRKKKKNRNLFRLSRAEKHLSIDRFLNPLQRLFSVKNSKRNGLSETRGAHQKRGNFDPVRLKYPKRGFSLEGKE